MHELRDYQIKALDSIYASLKEDPLFLFQGITGCGKTLIICKLINRLFHESDKRFLILINKMELISQFHQTFLDQTHINVFDIGICSASLNQFDISKRVTISTVQTFINRVDDYDGCDLLILDEVHNVSLGNGSQYEVVINKLREKVNNVRILGTSSTPHRLGHGYIYGNRCVKGGVNLFKEVGYQIKYAELLKLGYLCPMRGLIAHADSLIDDLANCEVNGDYVLTRLGEIMCKQIHLSTAVEAIHEHCMDYKHIACFCTTIDHSEKLKGLLGDKDCTTIHSQLTPLERAINMADWKSGKKKICTSVNILAEGFDFEPLDCLVLARPTLSSRLYLQAMGRALRIHPGKDHALLLDLTCNTARFGTDIDNVKVTIPKSIIKGILEKDKYLKICPNCEREVFSGFRVCPHCGFEWPVAEIIEANSVPELKEVAFKKKDPVPPKWVGVINMIVDKHKSRKSEKYLGKISYYTDDYYSKPVTVWYCLPDYYDFFPVEKSRQRWTEIMPGEPLPESVDDFIRYSIPMPTEILIDVTEQWPEVQGYRFDEGPDFVKEDDIPIKNLYQEEDDIPF